MTFKTLDFPPILVSIYCAVRKRTDGNLGGNRFYIINVSWIPHGLRFRNIWTFLDRPVK